MATSAKGKQSTAEKFLEQRRTRTSARTEEAVEVEQKTNRFEKITENPLYKILTDEATTPQQKQEAYTKALEATDDKTKAELREMQKANQELKDWLAEQNKVAAKELIRLSDTEAFAELQSVLDEMNSSLLNFEQMIGPLIDTIKAIHTLNVESGGKMYDVFKEIKQDEAEDARIAAEKAKIEEDVKRLEEQRVELRGDKAAALAKKSWYHFGKTPQSSIQEAERVQARIDSVNEQISAKNDEYKEVKSERESEFTHLAAEKEKLREFLNLSGEENVERQKKLVGAALNFVETMDAKSGNVLAKMNELGEHIEKVDDMNGKMQRAHKVIYNAEIDAAESSVSLAEEFNAKVKELDPDSLQAMEIREKMDNTNDHVTVLSDAAKTTQRTSLKLTEEATTIQGLQDNNRRQRRTANEMNTSGTASVANRLVSTLTSFSAAALNEGKTTLINTMGEIDSQTRDIMREEVIQAAAGAHQDNDELAALIEELAKTGDASEQGIEIQRAAIDTYKALNQEATSTMDRLRRLQEEHKGLASEALGDVAGPDGSTAADEQDNEQPKPSAGGLDLKI